MIILPPSTSEAGVYWLDQANLNSSNEQSVGQPAFAGAQLYSGVYSVEEFSVGDTEYYLRKPLSGAWYPTGLSDWEFVVSGMPLGILGRGESRDAAYRDWCHQVHSALQRLIRKRPFEMDVNERLQWHVLTSIIDTAKYRRETPIEMRQIGCVDQMGLVDKANPIPTRVAWASGQKERVSLDQMPGAFAALKLGQWFEAVVRRNPITGEIVNVTSVRRIKEIHPLTPEEQEEFWQSLPTSKSLPESHLDWVSPEQE